MAVADVMREALFGWCLALGAIFDGSAFEDGSDGPQESDRAVGNA